MELKNKNWTLETENNKLSATIKKLEEDIE